MSTDTEFICEVVRVTGISPHPGADRLEVAQFDTTSGPSAYRTVVGKGQFNAGDLALYVGVDSIVPRGHPAFLFLFDRLDGVGKDKFRVKAARIRGLYSEGFLAPVREFQQNGLLFSMGYSPAELLGITYHSPPSQGAPGLPAGAKPLHKDPTWGGRFPVYTVESLRKVPFLFEQAEPVVYTEKIHGTNFRAGYLKGKLVVGSHRTIKTDVRGFWRRLADWFRGRKWHGRGEGFYGEDVWLDTIKQWHLDDKLEGFCPGIVVYGEVYGTTATGKPIQDMTYGAPTLGLRLFDAYDTETNTWLSWAELGTLCAILGVPRVPELAVGTYDLDTAKALAEGRSTVDPAEIREGTVVRPLGDEGSRRRGKYVSDSYKLRANA